MGQAARSGSAGCVQFASISPFGLHTVCFSHVHRFSSCKSSSVHVRIRPSVFALNFCKLVTSTAKVWISVHCVVVLASRLSLHWPTIICMSALNKVILILCQFCTNTTTVEWSLTLIDDWWLLISSVAAASTQHKPENHFEKSLPEAIRKYNCAVVVVVLILMFSLLRWDEHWLAGKGELIRSMGNAPCFEPGFTNLKSRSVQREDNVFTLPALEST